jgi:hypothetical protein
MMNRCHNCSRKFGLIVYHWLGYTFCSKKCKADYLAKRSQQIERMRQWLSYLKPS